MKPLEVDCMLLICWWQRGGIKAEVSEKLKYFQLSFELRTKSAVSPELHITSMEIVDGATSFAYRHGFPSLLKYFIG